MRFGVGRGDRKTGGKEAKFNSGSVIDAIITDEIVVVVHLLTELLFFGLSHGVSLSFSVSLAFNCCCSAGVLTGIISHLIFVSFPLSFQNEQAIICVLGLLFVCFCCLFRFVFILTCKDEYEYVMINHCQGWICVVFAGRDANLNAFPPNSVLITQPS